MKKLVVFLLVGSIPYLTLAQWYDKTNGLPSGRAGAIDAYDSLIATGPYTKNPDHIPDSLYMTTNGGDNWYTIPLPGTLVLHDGLVDISIIRKDKIWFCTGLGKIYSTTDGGFSWQLQFYDTLKTKFINYIEMFDSLNGMAMGDAPANDKPALFLKTTNGGVDWISQNDSSLVGLVSGDIWRRVDFENINVGYFFSSGESPQKLYKTSNGGIDWEVINDTIYCAVIKGYDENIFLGVDTDGTINRTIDGGQNWESLNWNILGWALDLEFTPGNPSKVWCGSDAVFSSNDTGKTWVEEFDVMYTGFYDIVFTDENSGWIYGGGGGTLTHIFRTTNGGVGGLVSVDENTSAYFPNEFILLQNFPNPFNPSTTISYQIPQQELVAIKVYDILGNEIVVLINEKIPAGSYEVEFSASNLPSGIYFYRLQAGSFVETKKMVLLK